MRKPKDLILDDGQRAIVSGSEILLFLTYRKMPVHNADKLSKWLSKATLYLKNKKEKRDSSGYLP